MPFTLQSGNFHEVLPDILVFLKFYSNVLTEIKYSDNAIEFYTENYILGQIFKKGTQKIPALVPHPRVWWSIQLPSFAQCTHMMTISDDIFLHKETCYMCVM